MGKILALPWWQKVLPGVVALFLLIQLYPVWAQQRNPPVTQEPAWDSPQTRELAQRACFDCHSNETTWPLYSRIAPVSWVVTDHVIDGRQHLNFSEWGRSGEEAEEIAEVINEGEMPLPNYLPLHPEAQLTAAEQQQLIDGMYATIGGTPSRGGGEEEHEEDEYEEHEEDEY